MAKQTDIFSPILPEGWYLVLTDAVYVETAADGVDKLYGPGIYHLPTKKSRDSLYKACNDAMEGAAFRPLRS